MKNDKMVLRVLFDSKSLDAHLSTGWGVSFLVGESTVFDTGENGNYLLRNMNHLNVDLNALQNVVISHDHFDHTGGLWKFLRQKKGLRV